MKKLLIIAALALSIPVFTPGCANTPQTEKARVVAVQTLKSVGQAAETAVGLSAQLYRDGKITAVQARQVLDLYNHEFQPVFRMAVTAAHSDYSSIASSDLITLSAQISALVISFQTHSP